MDLRKQFAVTAQLDHIAINTADFEETVCFFKEVLGMDEMRQTGIRPSRKTWFQQGIQVCEITDAGHENDVYGHIAIRVSDKADVLEKAKAYGCMMVEGKNGWILTPDGIIIELLTI